MIVYCLFTRITWMDKLADRSNTIEWYRKSCESLYLCIFSRIKFVECSVDFQNVKMRFSKSICLLKQLRYYSTLYFERFNIKNETNKLYDLLANARILLAARDCGIWPVSELSYLKFFGFFFSSFGHYFGFFDQFLKVNKG